MAVDAPQQGTRRSGRPKAVARLLALLGVPLFVLFAIFAGGVYFGALRSYRIQTLEAEFLGFEPPALPPVSTTSEPPVVADASPTQPESNTPDSNTPETNTPDSNTPETKTPDTNAPPPTTETPPQPTKTSALPVAVAEPIGAELRSRYDEPLVVRVKLLVDPALVVAREDWLTYAASLVDAANASFELLFGIEVRLQGIVVWELDRVQAAGPDALLTDLMLTDLGRREREGADVLLGLVAGTEPPGFVAPTFTGDVHGNQALVFADLRQRDRYYLNLLEALAGLLGAERTHDAAAKQLGSFMTDAEPPEGAAPVIDPDNRGRVIINKRRPFAPPLASGAPRVPVQPEPGADDVPTDAKEEI